MAIADERRKVTEEANRLVTVQFHREARREALKKAEFHAEQLKRFGEEPEQAA